MPSEEPRPDYEKKMKRLECQSCGAPLKIVRPRWDGLIECAYCGAVYRDDQPQLQGSFPPILSGIVWSPAWGMGIALQ